MKILMLCQEGCITYHWCLLSWRVSQEEVYKFHFSSKCSYDGYWPEFPVDAIWKCIQAENWLLGSIVPPLVRVLSVSFHRRFVSKLKSSGPVLGISPGCSSVVSLAKRPSSMNHSETTFLYLGLSPWNSSAGSSLPLEKNRALMGHRKNQELKSITGGAEYSRICVILSIQFEGLLDTK